MYAAHSSAASALTAQVAAAAAHQQQLNRAGGGGSHSQQGGSRQHKPLHKEDFVEVEKSNMVMLVGWCSVAGAEADGSHSQAARWC